MTPLSMARLAIIDGLACERSKSGPAQDPTQIAKVVTGAQEAIVFEEYARIDEK
jgi:hypothetical protein